MGDPGEKHRVIPRIFSALVGGTNRAAAFSLPGGIAEGDMLVVGSGEVTDLLFSAPLVNFFHRRFPGVKSTVLAETDNAPIVRETMKVDTLISVESGQLKLYRGDYLGLARKLRKRNFRTALLPGRSFSLERALLALASGADIRIGFGGQGSAPFVNCEIRLSSGGYEGNKMHRVLESIGIRRGGELPPVTLTEHARAHARQLIHFRKPERDIITVGLDPGRGKTRHRVISEIIAYLANNLAGRRKAKFLVLTCPRDEKAEQRFAGELKGEKIDLVPADVAEGVAYLSQCDLFVSGNTNLFHFAAALGVPTVGLFTRSDDGRWVPDDAPNVRIFKGKRGEKLSLNRFFTMVEEVMSSRPTVSI